MSEQQASTSEQISRNVEAINNVTQESAAGIQQIARSAEDLNNFTSKLKEMIFEFRLDESDINYNENHGFSVRSNGRIIKS